jgi:hypothetical protein
MCRLLGTSVLRNRRVFRTDVPSSQHKGRLIVEQLASPEPAALLQLTQGLIAGLLWGDLETAEDLTRAAIARFRELEPQSLVWWLGGLGYIQALAGKRKAAGMAVPDCGGQTVVVKNGHVLASGRWPLLMRAMIDRRSLKARR